MATILRAAGLWMMCAATLTMAGCIMFYDPNPSSTLAGTMENSQRLTQWTLNQSDPHEIWLGVRGLRAVVSHDLYHSSQEQLLAFRGLAQVACKLGTGWPDVPLQGYPVDSSWVIWLMCSIAKEIPSFVPRYMEVGRQLPSQTLREIWRRNGVAAGFSQHELDEICESPVGSGDFTVVN